MCICKRSEIKNYVPIDECIQTGEKVYIRSNAIPG